MIFSKNIAVTALSTLVLTAFHANSAWALDFKTAYEAALQHDATILAERAAAQAAQERLPQALSQRRPSLSLSAGQNRNHLESQTANMLGQRSVSERYYDSNNAALQLRQPLYRPAILAQIKQARAQVQDADAVLDVNENDLLERVAQAYFDALLGQVQLDLASAQKTAFAAQLQSAQKGFAAGVGMRTDVDEAQARMDLAHAQVLQAQQALDLARRRLALLLGVPVAQLVQLADLDTQRFAPSAPVPTSAEQWIALAEESSPQLQALRARLRAAQAEVDKAQAGHKPTLDVVATVSRSDSDSVTSINTVYKQKYVGVQLNVPLYSGGYVSSTVRQALAEVQRMQQTLEAAQRDLAQARYGYVLAHLKLQMLAGQERMANVDAVNRWLKTQG